MACDMRFRFLLQRALTTSGIWTWPVACASGSCCSEHTKCGIFLRKLLKIITLIKMCLWITAVFFLLSSTNFVSVKWGNMLNINIMYENTLCSPKPYQKPTAVVKLTEPAALLKSTVNSHQPGNIGGRHKKKELCVTGRPPTGIIRWSKKTAPGP